MDISQINLSYGWVYKTTNIINGKIYIGQQKRREKDYPFAYYHTYLGSGLILLNAVKKYGRNNFYKEYIDFASSAEELNEKEKYWINFYDSRDHSKGYNISIGGEESQTDTTHMYNPKQENKGRMIPLKQKEDFSKLGWRVGWDDSSWFQIESQEPIRIRLRSLESRKNQLKENQDFKIIKNCPICGFPNSKESFACCQLHQKEFLLKCKKEISKKCGERNTITWSKSTKIVFQQKISKSLLIDRELNPRRWVTDGSQDKNILEEELSQYLNQGWQLGRCQNHQPTPVFSDEAKQKLKEFRTGKKDINKDGIVKSVGQSELEIYLNNGWQLGRTKEMKEKSSVAHTGCKHLNRIPRVWMWKENDSKMIPTSDLDLFLSQGWQKGMSPSVGKKISDEGKKTYSCGYCWIYKDIVEKRIPKDRLDSFLQDGWAKGKSPEFCKKMKEALNVRSSI